MADTYWATTSATGQGSSDASSEANRQPLEDLLNDIAIDAVDPDNGLVTINLKAEGVREWSADDIVPVSPQRTHFLELPSETAAHIHLRAYTDTPGDGGIAVYRLVGSPTAGVSGFLTVDGGTGWAIEGICAIGNAGTSTPRGFVNTAGLVAQFINCAAVGWPGDGFYNDLNPSAYFGCLSLNNGGDGFRAADDGRYYNCRAIGNGGYGFDFDDGSDGDTTVAVQCEATANGIDGFRAGSSGTLIRCAAFYNASDGFDGSCRFGFGCLAGGNGDYGSEGQNMFFSYSDFDALEDANGIAAQTTVNSNVNRNPVTGTPAFVTVGSSPQELNDYRNQATSDYVGAGVPLGGTLALQTAALAG